jgi:hypothetical protein
MKQIKARPADIFMIVHCNPTLSQRHTDSAARLHDMTPVPVAPQSAGSQLTHYSAFRATLDLLPQSIPNCKFRLGIAVKERFRSFFNTNESNDAQRSDF